jgi:nucleotide-binding universal stress UspA family protein
MVTLNKVLVATDFGEASAAALRYGRALASAFGGVLQVLHVTENLALMPLASLEGNVGLPPGVQEDIERAASQQTERLLTDDDRQRLHAQAVTITSDRTADTIIEFARANNVDLIVLGTHGRRALKRLVMGSVAERIVRTAPCPVLTVHSLQHEFVGVDLLTTAEAAVAP